MILVTEEKVSDPKTQTNNLLNYLETQDFSKRINLKEIFDIDFELSEAEEDDFTQINNHVIMKFFKIILFMIGLQTEKGKYDLEQKDLYID